MILSILSPINRAGWPFIAIFAVITLALFYVWFPVGWIGVILTLWCVYFFGISTGNPHARRARHQSGGWSCTND